MQTKSALLPSILLMMATTQGSALNAPAQPGFYPVQQISVSNRLANLNATNGEPGMTQTPVIVAFNNGAANACYTTTLEYQGSINLSVGSGQPCVAPVTSISFTPIASPAGVVFSAPENITIDSNYFSTQIVINKQTEPEFDSSNGMISTRGTVAIATQGQ